MISTLSIRDVVLIEKLDLVVERGLTALTGETGAGKSILLDALGLALGLRAEARLVRAGAAQASVAAEFRLPADSPVFALLAEQGITAGNDKGHDDKDANGEGALILRRVLGADGRSRAFINDEPVGVGLLRRVGDALVEIHGQFETQRLLDAAAHRGLLDAFAGLAAETERVAAAWHAWREAEHAARAAAEGLDKARREEEFLRHVVEELSRLAPKAGEETELSSARALHQHAGRVADAVRSAGADLDQGRGVEGALSSAARHLERVATQAGGRLDGSIAALNRAASEAVEARAQIERAAQAVDIDPAALEKAETRLFALRAAARKHGVEPDRLPEAQARFEADLAAIEDGGANARKLAAEANARRKTFVVEAAGLSKARRAAAGKLAHAVTAEMEPLKLGRAGFLVRVDEAPEADWGPSGCDRVGFEAQTNPGQPPGPLNRIASGGELARFMLALKAVLAGADPVPVLIFDEVDSGVGGAVAAAVGERLGLLSASAQVLVVTHSPQVAARGDHHLRVMKAQSKGAAVTTVEALTGAEREEEIARMLAGATVTAEARAAAKSLLGAARAASPAPPKKKPTKARAAT